MTDGGFSRQIFNEQSHERTDMRRPVRAFGSDARDLKLTISDISAEGFVARSDDKIDIGERIRVMLPMVGSSIAVVGWMSDGRIGCRFEQAIDRASYYELLAAMVSN